MSEASRDFAIETARLHLRTWRDGDRDAMAAMLADPEVMWDWGGPLSRAASDEKVDRYIATFREHGFTRWLVEHERTFVGYVGVFPHGASHVLGPHADIGWRLVREAWGRGFATEAAAAALRDIFERIGLREVLAYTSGANARSQAVMRRLRLVRDATRDFTSSANGITDQELVWVARGG